MRGRLLISLLLCATSAQAAARARLEVERDSGAEACSDAQQLARRVNQIAGSDAVAVGAWAPVSTRVTVLRDAGQYQATLTVSGEQQGVRRLSDDGPDCRALDEALAVTLALLLDPNARAELAPPPVLPSPRRSPELVAPEPQAALASARLPTEKAPRRPDFGLRGELGVGAAAGVLAHPVALGGFGLGVVTRRWGVGLGAQALLPDRVSSAGGFVDLRLEAAYLRGSVALLGARDGLALELGGGPYVGRLRGVGQRYDRNSSQSFAWLAAAFGARLRGPVSPLWSWYFSLLGVAPLGRRSLSIIDDGARSAVFQTPSLGVLFTMGFAAEP